MADKKSPVQRFSMSYAPGKTATLGYWPPELETNGAGWSSQAFAAHRDTLAIAKKYSDQNQAYAAQAANSPPPDLGDLVTRHQRAMADYKRMAALANKLSAIEKEVASKEAALKPFDYSDSLRDAMLRQERRSHMRNSMSDDERKQAMRDPSWAAAALETDAEQREAFKRCADTR
jgi:hypothetical protein